MSRLDNRAYYDDFAGWYERERHLPYHRMLDDLEVEIVQRYATDKTTLEVGCGTGLILTRVAEFARDAHGIDLSGGMLAKAAARGLSVAQASATTQGRRWAGEPVLSRGLQPRRLCLYSGQKGRT